MSLWKWWSSKPLAGRILAGMILGLVVGAFLHGLDRPLSSDDPSLVHEALLGVDGWSVDLSREADSDGDGVIASVEWNAWLAQRRSAPLDANGDGSISSDEMLVWRQSGPVPTSVLDRADQVYRQVLEVGASIDQNGDGQLDAPEILEWKTGLMPGDRELLRSADKALSRVKGGRGRPIADTIAIIGDLFLGLIKAVVVPLVFVAVLAGIAANDDVATVRRIGGGIIVYFICTTLVAVTIGSILAATIKPGKGMPAGFREKGMANAAEVAQARGITRESVAVERMTLRERVRSYIPTNLFHSLAGANTLAIVIFAALFGAVLLLLREHADDEIRLLANRTISWFTFLLEICMTIVRWAMKLAPYGVFALMADITARAGLHVLGQLGLYAGTVLAGLVCLLGVYALLVRLIAGRSPLEFFRHIGELQLLAFSTSSSAAVMPRSLVTAEQKLGVDRSVARFTIPLGTTINMDGTALYQAVGAVFLMQVFDVPVTFAAVGTILFTTILASIGTPGMPGVGIFVLAGILQANGVPYAGIALIIGVDRILDMCRTTINVTGDQCACLVMERLVGRKIKASLAEP